MKQRFLALLLAGLIATPLFAGDKHESWDDTGVEIDLFLRELSGALEEQEGARIDSLTLGDISDIAAQVSVRLQAERFIAESRRVSFVHPGAGHLMNGEKTTGALLMGANVAIIAGTVVGAYFLLPNDIRFDELNYFEDSFGDIETAWKSTSFVDYLPAAGVVVGGLVVKGVLGYFAAQGAERLARERVESGAITFEPFDAAGKPGMGFRWSY
jgi:hypothetical protein